MADSDAVRKLETAAREYETARERVDDVGRERLATCRDAYRQFRDLLDRYEETATGSGNFQAFTEFQGAVATLTDDLDEDVPERETFEAVDEALQQRRLTESDFERARRDLEPVGDLVARLDDLEAAREAYRTARREARRRLDDLESRVADLERLQRLGEADLDAPVEELRAPIEEYNAAVREAFRTFRSEQSAREVLETVARADAYPLVPFRSPPEDLLEYVRTHEAGAEPVPRLLEYADYSTSKLDHYVDDTAALKRAVATRQTYLERLDAAPVTVDWPPPPADHLAWVTRAYQSVVVRFADEPVVARLREVRALSRRDDYARLRDTALARNQLTDGERDRLESGAVERDLAAAREEREAIEAALDEYGEL
ncbi:hypothetical protein ACFQGE_07945 [Halomicroarcula sp. GCM10025817]|uniref:DUF7118 family protein n=1 Tax=Haloarcula TaxID=2237 RepID=UPI0023E81AFE|nr:hypothetical protein [Halomicroarcula sp. SYNS111]